MASERCPVCGSDVPFDGTVHVMIHTHSDEGVVDHYICRSCYDEELAPLFEGGAGEPDAR